MLINVYTFCENPKVTFLAIYTPCLQSRQKTVYGSDISQYYY